MHYSITNTNILDVYVTKKNEKRLSIDLFSKDTDSHQYLHATSSHPPNCKKSISYGQVSKEISLILINLKQD